MFPLLIVLISLIALFLCVIILLQSGKGGGLAASFGGASSSTDSFMGGKQTATALTKMTWIGGGAFLFLALVLTVLSSRPADVPESILRQGLPGQPATLPEAPPSLLETQPAAEDPPATEGAVIPPTEGTEDPGGA